MDDFGNGKSTTTGEPTVNVNEYGLVLGFPEANPRCQLDHLRIILHPRQRFTVYLIKPTCGWFMIGFNYMSLP